MIAALLRVELDYLAGMSCITGHGEVADGADLHAALFELIGQSIGADNCD